ncbi:MAG: hypothetical protein RR398_03110 [Clostridia bacterium]
MKNSGREVNHNVQIAVKPTNHLIVAVDIIGEAVDREQLHNYSGTLIDSTDEGQGILGRP